MDLWERTVAADANGGFVVSPYFVELRHLGVQFHVTALGAQSTMRADVKFTDAGSFDFDPTSQSYINPPVITHFIENVTAPKNNGTFDASLVFTGTGGTQIPSSWVTLSPGARRLQPLARRAITQKRGRSQLTFPRVSRTAFIQDTSLPVLVVAAARIRAQAQT